jgi:hypothetical protein
MHLDATHLNLPPCHLNKHESLSPYLFEGVEQDGLL